MSTTALPIAAARVQQVPQALYLHVPFCPHICPYCDFHKMRRHEGLVARYLTRILEEARAYQARYPQPPRTLYLGGGTPSHLRDDELAPLLEGLAELWDLTDCEISLEADPLTFDPVRLQHFASWGIARLSIGLQSTQDAVLRFLGRQHSGAEGLQALSWALEAGFEVSADIITAIDGQDTARDLHQVAASGVPHLSVYTLTIEPHTSFSRRGVTVSEAKDYQDYQLSQRILAEYGLQRYEVSSYARPGHASKHNQVYWHGDYFIALGPSAAGFVPHAEQVGMRYVNPPIKAWLAGGPPEQLLVSSEDYVRECLMTGLRTRRGVDGLELARRSGIDIYRRFADVLARYYATGLLASDGHRLWATDAGILQLNGIVSSFYQN